jgi:peptide/nickel transport system permease protein
MASIAEEKALESRREPPLPADSLGTGGSFNAFLTRSWRLLTFNLETKIGLVIVGAFVLTAIVEALLGWSILPYSPIQPNFSARYLPPSTAHFFGTSDQGYDVFSRIVAGTPNDAMVSFFVVTTAFVSGGLLGSFAGLRGGWIDEALMRITDVFFAIPSLILAMAIAVILGTSPVNLMAALALIWWPPYARLARSEALRLSNTHFVESAKLSGLSSPRIMIRHIFPIAATTLMIYATLDIGTLVLTYSGLAYLGFAVRPPFPDWGADVANFQQAILGHPWLPLIPAGIIVIVAVGFSLLGDGLRGALRREYGRL